MTPEQIEEARRWVALPGWRWMAGMLTVGRLRILRVDSDGYAPGYREGGGYIDALGGDPLPDLNDPATRGCLLALAREITGRADLSTVWISPADVWWSCWSARRRNTFGEARSAETAALLKAVEDYYRALAREEGA